MFSTVMRGQDPAPYSKTTHKGETPPKTAQIYLNSQERMSGTTDNATFHIKLPCEFMTDKLNLTLTNFIPSYPTNTPSGIVHINMIGAETPFTYSSSNRNTHRILGMFPLGEGRSREYPPAGLTSNTTNITGQSYGNGIHIASASTSVASFQPWRAFNRDSNANSMFNSVFSSNSSGIWDYDFITGVYNGVVNFFSTNVDGSNVSGEWLNIQTPDSFVLREYRIQGNPVAGQVDRRSPNTFTLAGSVDGINFSRIDTESNIDWWGSNDTFWNTFPTPSNIVPYNQYRLIVHRVGNSNLTNFRNGVQVNEMVLVGHSQSSRIGQSNLNCEVITTDKTMFNRPITMSLTSPTGMDLSGMSEWSAQLSVSEIGGLIPHNPL